jgi:hypothetical protein
MNPSKGSVARFEALAFTVNAYVSNRCAGMSNALLVVIYEVAAVVVPRVSCVWLSALFIFSISLEEIIVRRVAALDFP